MEWMVVAMMMGGGGDESIDRPNDHHAVVGMHVDGVDGHVDDDLVNLLLLNGLPSPEFNFWRANTNRSSEIRRKTFSEHVLQNSSKYRRSEAR